ncbi:MAG: hypothetical protein KF865_06355 [Bdellovibrionaceae bacterium]|nr:hypothetical protein [Pseudobdellovibrionaceae bacterium]
MQRAAKRELVHQALVDNAFMVNGWVETIWFWTLKTRCSKTGDMNLKFLFFICPVLLMSCDAHLRVRKELPLTNSFSERCLQDVIHNELRNSRIEARLYNGLKYWAVSSDVCSFDIELEDRVSQDGPAKLLILSKSVIADGLNRAAGNKEISASEHCIERVKPVIEAKCSSTVR